MYYKNGSCTILLTAMIINLSASTKSCGSRLTSKNGFLSTPQFPERFATPLKCEWVICNEGIEKADRIAVYLTQLYVFTGLVSVMW